MSNLKFTDKVNELLKENASIWANLGTGSRLDLGTKEAANKRWEEILEEIKTLDTELWQSLIVEQTAENDFEEPSFINKGVLVEMNANMPKTCNIDDDEECWSCGA